MMKTKDIKTRTDKLHYVQSGHSTICQTCQIIKTLYNLLCPDKILLDYDNASFFVLFVVLCYSAPAENTLFGKAH